MSRTFYPTDSSEIESGRIRTDALLPVYDTLEGYTPGPFPYFVPIYSSVDGDHDNDDNYDDRDEDEPPAYSQRKSTGTLDDELNNINSAIDQLDAAIRSSKELCRSVLGPSGPIYLRSREVPSRKDGMGSVIGKDRTIPVVGGLRFPKRKDVIVIKKETTSTSSPTLNEFTRTLGTHKFDPTSTTSPYSKTQSFSSSQTHIDIFKPKKRKHHTSHPSSSSQNLAEDYPPPEPANLQSFPHAPLPPTSSSPYSAAEDVYQEPIPAQPIRQTPSFSATATSHTKPAVPKNSSTSSSRPLSETVPAYRQSTLREAERIDHDQTYQEEDPEYSQFAAVDPGSPTVLLNDKSKKASIIHSVPPEVRNQSNLNVSEQFAYERLGSDVWPDRARSWGIGSPPHKSATFTTEPRKQLEWRRLAEDDIYSPEDPALAPEYLGILTPEMRKKKKKKKKPIRSLEEWAAQQQTWGRSRPMYLDTTDVPYFDPELEKKRSEARKQQQEKELLDFEDKHQKAVMYSTQVSLNSGYVPNMDKINFVRDREKKANVVINRIYTHHG